MSAAVYSRGPLDDPSEALPFSVLDRFFSSEEEEGSLSRVMLGLGVRLSHGGHLLEVLLVVLDEEGQVVVGLLVPLASFGLAVACYLNRSELLVLVVTIIVLH